MLNKFLENADNELFLEEIYKDNYTKMYAIAFKILHNKEDAEDAVLDVFKSITEKFSILSQKLNDNSQWSNYLNMSVHNRALNIVRSNQKQIKIQEKVILNIHIQNDGDFIDDIENKYEAEKIANALKKLPVKYKLVIYQRFVMELSYDEISEINNLKKSTVNQQITRGKKLLKQLLEEDKNVT